MDEDCAKREPSQDQACQDSLTQAEDEIWVFLMFYACGIETKGRSLHFCYFDLRQWFYGFMKEEAVEIIPVDVKDGE
jgi:hypothetical protein